MLLKPCTFRSWGYYWETFLALHELSSDFYWSSTQTWLKNAVTSSTDRHTHCVDLAYGNIWTTSSKTNQIHLNNKVSKYINATTSIPYVQGGCTEDITHKIIKRTFIEFLEEVGIQSLSNAQLFSAKSSREAHRPRRRRLLRKTQ